MANWLDWLMHPNCDYKMWLPELAKTKQGGVTPKNEKVVALNE